MNAVVTAARSSRRLAVGATFNLRDVGGYPAARGAWIRWGRLFRSDAAAFTDGADLAALGLRTVIDLRDDDEVAMLPTGLDALVPRTLHLPLESRSLLRRLPTGSSDPLGELYAAMVRERGAELARTVAALTRPAALPALVHCAAGKDRTGVVIGIVLAAVGVPDDVVAADYALTADYLDATFFANVPRGRDVATIAPHDVLRAARPESMTALLRVLAGEYGGARAYLVEHGLPAAAVDDLHLALTR